MTLLQRRAAKLESYYEQFTGCPHCGLNPDGEPVEVHHLRDGMTNGMGSRLSTYQRDNDFFPHVAVIHVRHHHPGTSRDAARAYEAKKIGQNRRPFNVQHNPDHNGIEQEILRAEILGQPVTWIQRGELFVSQARTWLRRALLWAGSAGIAGILSAVAARAAFGG